MEENRYVQERTIKLDNLSQEDYDTLMIAASIVGKTIEEFVIDAALERAEEVIDTLAASFGE